MKNWILLIVVLLAANGVFAVGQYRDFVDSQGRTIRGKVLRFEARTQTVTIERDNKKITKVPITIFSEADQSYILEWDAAKGFTSDSLLKITCDDRQVEKQIVFSEICSYGSALYSDDRVYTGDACHDKKES